MVDVNGTRFHLVLGQADWTRFEPSPDEDESGWIYDAERQQVSLEPKIFRFPESTHGDSLKPDQRRGAAPDTYGNWYWISSDQRHVWARYLGLAAPQIYWPPAESSIQAPPDDSGPFQPKEPPQPPPDEPLSGLTVTRDDYLVIGSPLRGELIVFDLHTGGEPLRLPLPAPSNQPHPEQIIHRFDFTPTEDCGFLLLDRVEKRIWVYNAALQPASLSATSADALFQPKNAAEPVQEFELVPPEPIDLTGVADNPISIEAVPEYGFLVLDNPNDTASIIHFFPVDMTAPTAIPLTLSPGDDSADDLFQKIGIDLDTDLNILAHDLAFVPAADDKSIGALYLVRGDGKQAFASVVSLRDGQFMLALRPEYYPLRQYGNRALVAAAGEAYFDFRSDDSITEWLPLTVLPRRRYAARAELESGVFDGREPGCIWHRLCLDACIPPDTFVTIFSRAADDDDPDMLSQMDWQQEPPLCLRGRGAEIPYYALLSEAEQDDPDTGTWELLFQGAEGQYMQLKLVLEGNQRATPRLRALRAHYPRFSYLRRYLPDVYQRDDHSAQFLDRFLANTEGMLTKLEGLIAQVQVYFDARSTPPDAVEWLAGWVGLAFDSAWNDRQRRLLLDHALYFFRRRGTRSGIIQVVWLALEPNAEASIFTDKEDPLCTPVRLIELYQTANQSITAFGGSAADKPDTTDPDELAHQFMVLLPVDVPDEQVERIERLIELEKPAHTAFTVRRYWNMFRVGSIRLGLDTVLGHSSVFVPHLLGQTGLGEGVLGATYPDNLTNRLVLRD